MISQRFYCCGSKVVLNRLLCDLHGPRLCSHAAKNTVLWVESFHLDFSLLKRSDCVILKYGTSLSYYQGLTCNVCGSQKKKKQRQKTSSHCIFFFTSLFEDHTRGTALDEMTQ